MRRAVVWVVAAVMLLFTVQAAFAALSDVVTYRFPFDDSLKNFTGTDTLTPGGSGTTYSADAKLGNKSRSFTGAGYDQIVSNNSNITTGEFTIAFWLKTSSNSKTVASSGAGFTDNGQWLFYIAANGSIQIVLKNSGTEHNYYLPAVNNNAWRRVVLTRNASGTIKGYLDGVEYISVLDTFSLYIGTITIAHPSVNPYVGLIDDFVFWKGTSMSAAEVATDYNGGSGVEYPIPNVAPLTPAWVSPTPADTSRNNTNVVLNASSTSPGVRYYIWFDTNPTPSTLVVTNATSGEYTTAAAGTQTYYYRAAVWNATGGFSGNTSVRSWTFDAVSPAITLNPSNGWNTINESNRSQYAGTLPINITFTDDSKLYGFLINVTRGGTSYFNVTNATLTGTSATYTNTVNVASWPAGVYNVSVVVADSHTARSIPDYQVTSKKSSVTFKTPNGNNVKVESRAPSNITATRYEDRYSFRVVFDDGLTTARVFDVKTDACPLQYQENSKYKAHFVASCGVRGGNWLDFEGVAGNPSVEKRDDYHYVVTFPSAPAVVEFRSIGGLNEYERNYTVYVGNYSANTNPPAYSGEDVTYYLNVSVAAGSSAAVNFSLNGSSVTPSAASGAGWAYFAYTAASPSTPVNLSFVWNVTITQPSGANYTFNVSGATTALDFSLTSCGTTPVLRFSVFDENTPANPLNVSAEVEIDYYLTSPALSRTFNATFTDVYNVTVCVSPGTVALNADVFLTYRTAAGFTHRYYLNNVVLSNATTNRTIYNTNTTSGYSDLRITTRYASNYNYFKDVFVWLERRYPGEGVGRVVQMDRSGDYGLTVFNIIERSQEYRLKYYDENNTLLKETNWVKFACSSTICDVTQLLNPAGSSSSVSSVNVSRYWNNNTRQYFINWSSSEPSSTAVFNVTGETGATYCNATQTGTSGQISCNLTGRSGQARVSLGVDNAPAWAEWLSLGSARLGAVLSRGDSALFTALVVIVLVMVGIWSPIAVLVFGVVGLLAVLWFGLATWASVSIIGIAIVVSIVIGVRIRGVQ